VLASYERHIQNLQAALGAGAQSRDLDGIAAIRAIAASRLKPIIDKIFSFADAPAAYRYLQSAQHFG